MQWLSYLLCAAMGYLIGNIQFAVIISRMKYKDDVRNHGSGNAGSTNMVRVFGFKPGLVTFVGDFCKGLLGVVLGRLIAGEAGGYVAALFVVLGHDFPALLGFKGGKGVASSFGIIWAVNPIYGAVVTAVAAVVLLLFKTISIASLLGSTACFVVSLIFDMGSNVPRLVLIALIWALIVVRHRENIKRIIHGHEDPIRAANSGETDKKEA